MKPSRIICSRGATLRGLITADTSVAGVGWGGARHTCVAVRDAPSPRGVGPQWEWQRWWCHQNGPWHVVLKKKKKKMLAYARTVDLGGSGAWQPHYRQCIIPSNTGGRTSLLKELHGFTINNETQMAFYTFWLTVRGSSCFCFFFPISLHWGFFFTPPSSSWRILILLK